MSLTCCLALLLLGYRCVCACRRTCNADHTQTACQVVWCHLCVAAVGSVDARDRERLRMHDVMIQLHEHVVLGSVCATTAEHCAGKGLCAAIAGRRCQQGLWLWRGNLVGGYLGACIDHTRLSVVSTACHLLLILPASTHKQEKGSSWLLELLLVRSACRRCSART